MSRLTSWELHVTRGGPPIPSTRQAGKLVASNSRYPKTGIVGTGGSEERSVRPVGWSDAR